jgi:hypothetical protein
VVVKTSDLESLVNETLGKARKRIEAVLVTTLVGDLNKMVEGISLF